VSEPQVLKRQPPGRVRIFGIANDQWDHTAGTYLDMRQRMRLVDEPASGAIVWNYLFPRP
jgi:hypothetical protein